jgi:N-acetylglucosaminyl-diphospho-decaprenol L-rhamnosyltransferase
MPIVLTPKDLSISIVSHGHGSMVRNLLWDLQPIMQKGAQVLLTLNIPENEQFLVDLPIQPELIRNESIKGFGENHNQAFDKVDRSWFAVINPDIRVEAKVFENLLLDCSRKHIGAIAPRILGANGLIEDSGRFFPSLNRIIRRIATRLMCLHLKHDYDLSVSNLVSVDWISGCFMLFNSHAYSLIGGFDKNYFMYLEDADICRRLRFAGFEVMVSTSISATHCGQYASRSQLRYFCWHAKSMSHFLWRNRKLR